MDKRIFNLIKKGDIFICIEDNHVSVIQYLRICPWVDEPLFRIISDDYKHEPDLKFIACRKCKYKSECKKQPVEYWFEEDIIDYLKAKKLVRFNKLNAILYLNDKTRSKVYRYLE